jgi:hypothetical protein
VPCSEDRPDDDVRGPILEAIWIRIAYVAAGELLAAEGLEMALRRTCPDCADRSGNQEENAIINLIALNLQPLVKDYVTALIEQLIAARPEALTVAELCHRVDICNLAEAAGCDSELDVLLTTAVHTQFPCIFRQPRLVMIDQFVYRISQTDDQRLVADLMTA